VRKRATRERERDKASDVGRDWAEQGPN